MGMDPKTKEKCARFTEDLAMVMLAKEYPADFAIDMPTLVEFLLRHANDLRQWDGEELHVVDLPEATPTVLQ